MGKIMRIIIAVTIGALVAGTVALWAPRAEATPETPTEAVQPPKAEVKTPEAPRPAPRTFREAMQEIQRLKKRIVDLERQNAGLQHKVTWSLAENSALATTWQRRYKALEASTRKQIAMRDRAVELLLKERHK